jgi:hypothetical protein
MITDSKEYVTMTIHYALFENHLTTDPADYTAVVQPAGSADTKAIADRMVQQGSTVTRADIAAVMEDMIAASESLLLEGFRVNLGGLCELYVRLKGVFDGAVDTFDPSRHRLEAGANAGSRLRARIAADGTVAKDETILPSPSPIEYVDLGSGETNTTITCGNIGTLNGHRLSFNPAADEGIWLIHDGGSEIDITAVQKNKPGQLVFLIPAGIPSVGSYFFEVRKRFGDGDSALRTGRLDVPLSIAAS